MLFSLYAVEKHCNHSPGNSGHCTAPIPHDKNITLTQTSTK